jgi:hypothetical protein
MRKGKTSRGRDDHVLRNRESAASDGGDGRMPGLSVTKAFLDRLYKAWILLVAEAESVMTEAGEEADGFCRRRLFLDEDADEDESATLVPPGGIAATSGNLAKSQETCKIISGHLKNSHGINTIEERC